MSTMISHNCAHFVADKIGGMTLSGIHPFLLHPRLRSQSISSSLLVDVSSATGSGKTFNPTGGPPMEEISIRLKEKSDGNRDGIKKMENIKVK